jgi:hypothetical protein
MWLQVAQEEVRADDFECKGAAGFSGAHGNGGARDPESGLLRARVGSVSRDAAKCTPDALSRL